MLEFKKYIVIPQDYDYAFEGDVHSVMTNSFNKKIATFLKTYLSIQQQENYPFLPETEIQKFPFVDFKPYQNEIFTRKQDLTILNTIAENYLNNQSAALEIGGWNGWLTSRLAEKKVEVISSDIFSDEKNGLRSKQFYPKANWLSIQTDVCDTSIYQTQFELIIFNHCIHFYPKPDELIQKYKQLLKPNGLLVILGVSVYKNEIKQQENVATLKNYYQKKYNFDIYFYKGKGYFEKRLYQTLLKNNFTFIPYQLNFLGRLKAKFFSEKHGILFHAPLSKAQ